jgi:hypothetical protein
MADLQRMRRIGRSPNSRTLLHSQVTRNSPAAQVSRSRLFVITRSMRPVSGSRFAAMEVRELSCTRPAVAGTRGVGRVEFMPCSVPAVPLFLNIQKPEFRI